MCVCVCENMEIEWGGRVWLGDREIVCVKGELERERERENKQGGHR